ncbi:cytochrome P460 family protein [Oceanicella actignis]|uniref:Cytochrome P460 n=1 Tax=Oceanicella actignis TaxID=1189325 RepID=A0A1M7TJH3_9RHOB|nr:cytochrome P460 family protein [Oceanicella actignis]SET66512.1 Cytochrome P460 [Oceanicella actignis]SHN70865.1 Cytochrome P460 [Oceanicella actignis]
MIRIAILAGGLAAAASAAAAEECAAGKPRDQMTYEDAQAVYACLEDKMLRGYMTGPKRWVPERFVAEYRGWTRASNLPADPGFHGGRYLLTYVNPVGAATYLRFEEEGVKMPPGSVIAKESFSIDEQGKAAPGPLFIMQKAEPGASLQTGDWYYMMVAPNGAPQAVDVMTACNACHQNYADQDYMAYPVEEVRAR